VAQEKGYFLNK